MNQSRENTSAAQASPAPGLQGLVRVLVVDNDIVHARTMGEVLSRLDYQVTVVGSGTEGARKIEQESFDVVVTDLMMNDIGGLEILSRAKAASADTEVIGFEGVVGSSTQMLSLIERLKRIAPTDATVLIQGQTGTGKELVAQAIHQNSPRKSKPFVALNCAALSENILESELFGHVRGAFTDASSDRVGKFEYANGGTLFLDEVGDMPMPTQIKLLRVLESGEITRVGSNTPTRVNVRILSATNRNLEDAIATGSFRSDLYHRLKVVTIAIPTLRERAADIPLLIEHFIKQFAKRHSKTIKGMSLAARMKLGAYEWPGNVRQLRNVIESMVVVDCDELLDVDDLPLELEPETATDKAGTPALDGAPTVTVEAGLAALVGRPLEEVERILITETLKLTGGNREQAAELLGIGERTLYRKIKEYQLP